MNTVSGFQRLSWVQRIGFGSGDLAQNLIYQTISLYLMFYYTNVYHLNVVIVGTMFFIVRLVDVLLNPFVGTMVDKTSTRFGRYRAYLLIGGIPLVFIFVLCFWNGFSGSVLYAYVSYVALTIFYTLVNVPYGALNASLTRDNKEISILTTVRMIMANIGGLIVGFGVPRLLKYFDPNLSTDMPETDGPWLAAMSILGIAALILLIFCFIECKERVVMDNAQASRVKISDLWKELIVNRPLRVLCFFFFISFTLLFISNSTATYYINYNMHGNADMLSLFMGIASVPALIFMPMIPKIKDLIGKKELFYFFLLLAIVGMLLIYITTVVPTLSKYVVLIYIGQFVRSTGLAVATGYMWVLVPEVISYGEFIHGRRISGIVNSLTGLFFKVGMMLGGAIPGWVLGFLQFNPNSATQSIMAQHGILWLFTIIPAIMLLVAMFIISRYNLDDNEVERINREIESRREKESKNPSKTPGIPDLKEARNALPFPE